MGAHFENSLYVFANQKTVREFVACEHAHVGVQARIEAQAQIERRITEVTFLAPLHHTPSHRIALLFVARAHDSKVSLHAG